MADDVGPDFKEAAIYQANISSRGAEYVASCARDLCGYFGECPAEFWSLSFFDWHVRK
jgi:hypothetical protein